MQRAEDEHAGFRRGQGQRDGFQVAHFTDEHDVGIFAHGIFQAVGKARRVLADFALRDDAELVRMHELDRLLDGDDVARVAAVDEVDQGRQRGRFARAGRAGDQDKSTPDVGKPLDDRRNIELLQRRNLVRNQTKDAAVPVQVLVEIAPETRLGAELVGAVDVARFEKFLPAFRSDHLAEHLFHLGMREHVIPQFLDVAVQAHLGRLALLHVKIGRLGFDDGVEVIVDHDTLMGSLYRHAAILKALAGDADEFLRSSLTFRGRPPQTLAFFRICAMLPFRLAFPDSPWRV